MRKLNEKKKQKSGEDGIPNQEWLYRGNGVLEELEDISNKIWKGEQELSKEWNCRTVAPVYKRGDKNQACNYRGITLMDTGYKIHVKVLRTRLEKAMQEKKNARGHTNWL